MDCNVSYSNRGTEKPVPRFYINVRHVLAAMMFLSVLNMFATRASLSVAIVAMVNTTTNTLAKLHQETPYPQNGVFHWGSAEQGLLLGSYYYGYLAMNVPGAWLSQRFGIRRVLLAANVLTTLLTLGMPLAARQGFGSLLALRVILGLAQGPFYTSSIGSWGVWAPEQERSFLVATTFSGSSLGICFSMALSGMIAGGLGWENVFYITGGLSGLISVLWFFLVYDSPGSHPRISEEEKRYITENNSKVTNKNQRKVPWTSILTSLPVYGMIISHFCFNFGAYTLLSMLPTYMASILKFNVASSGGLSALPYVIEWVFTIGTGYVTDQIRLKRLASTTVVRKANTVVGEVVPAMFVVLAGYVGCNPAAAVSFFALAVGFQAVTASGCRANAVDIAPVCSGIVFAISNSISNITGFLAPLVAGFVLEQDGSLSGWRKLFWITGGIYVFGALVFLVIGSGKEQAWAKVREEETSPDAEDKML